MRLILPFTGEEREVRMFAIVPIIIDREIYWLEWVTIHQTYNTRKPGWNNDWVV